MKKPSDRVYNMIHEKEFIDKIGKHYPMWVEHKEPPSRAELLIKYRNALMNRTVCETFDRHLAIDLCNKAINAEVMRGLG